MELTQAQIDDLRFRRRVVLPTFIAIIILSYIFFAFRFEYIFKRDCLDPNGQYGFVFDVKPEDVELDRFLFRAKLKNAVLFPNSKDFKVTSDIIYFGYNPINNFIQIYFGGNAKVGTPETGIIISSPSQKYNFRAILLDKDYDNLNFEFTAGKLTIYSQKDLNHLYSSEGSTIKFTCALSEEGFYRIDFKSDLENINYSYNPREYIDYILQNIVPNFIKNQPNYQEDAIQIKDYYELTGRIIGVTQAHNYKNNISIKLYKQHMDNLAAVVKGTLNPIKALQQFDVNKDIYSFNFTENGKSPNSRFSSSLKLTHDGNIINAVTGFSSTNEFKDEARAQMADLGLEYAKKNIFPIIKNFSITGLDELVKKYMMAKSFSFSINYIYNIPNDAHTILTNNTLNDFGLKLETKIKDNSLDSYAIITSPTTLVPSIKKAYDSGLRSLIIENFYIDPNYLDKLVIAINNNGLKFLNSFKKNTNNEEITADITLKINSDNIDFKVNGKTIDEIKEYKYVKRFIRRMPKYNENQSELIIKNDN